MKYKTYNMEGYRLFIQSNDQFKTVYFNMCLKIEATNETILNMLLLAQILHQGTKDYPNERLLEYRCAEIYDPMYYIEHNESGKFSVLRVGCKFINEIYTEKGMNEAAIKFMLNMLLNPDKKYNEFNQANFDYVKKRIKTNIESIKEKPRKYAANKLLELIDKNSTWGYTPDQMLKDLEKLTNKDLYKFYKKILKESSVDVFIIGNIDHKQIKQIFENNLTLTNKHIKESHFMEAKDFREKPKTTIEKSPFEQTILGIGYKLKPLTKFERNYVKSIYLTIVNRILFDKIREKNSLCYYIGMSSINTRDVLIINSGIEPDTYKKTIKLIEEEIKNINKGEFEDNEIDIAKAIYLNTILEIEDDQKRILNTIEAHEYVETDLLEQREKNINKITKKDIIQFAKKIKEDSIYVLEGGFNEKE